MNIWKTSFYTSISQALSLCAGFITIKVVAGKIGPSGIAMMGQYLNITTLLALLASGAIGTGVVKYLAEFKDDRERQLDIIRSAVRITALCTLGIALFAAAASCFLSKRTFKTPDYFSLYIFWSVFLFFTSFSALFSNILNGLKLIPYLTLINVSGTVIGTCITIWFTFHFGVFGVLVATNFTALVLFCIHLFFINKYRWFPIRSVLVKESGRSTRLLTGFISMTLVSGILSPLIQFAIRDRIITKFSFTEAGYWQSVTRISDYYLNFITAVIGVYYLPRLSEINDLKELKTEILKMYKIILPVIAGTSFLIWLCRYLVIRLLLTPKFLPSAELYAFQFIGDFFKIAAWLLGYVMLAKAMRSWFIVSEIVFSLSYLLFSYLLIGKYGVVGATYGFLVNNIILWITMVFFIRKYLTVYGKRAGEHFVP